MAINLMSFSKDELIAVIERSREQKVETETKVWETFLNCCSHSANPEEWEQLTEILTDIAALRNIDLDGIMQRFAEDAT